MHRSVVPADDSRPRQDLQRGGDGLRWLTRGTLLLACWALSDLCAPAQPPIVRDVEPGYLAPSPRMESFGPPSEPAVYGPVGPMAGPSFGGPMSAAGPLGHGLTFRHGLIASSVGGGTFDDHLDETGWTVEVMVRQPLFRRNQSSWFWEAGGLYLHNPGDTGGVITSGTALPENQDPVFLENFRQTRLKRLQRAGVQIGTGVRLFSDGFHGNKLLTLRGGFRFGHAAGRFERAPTQELQDVLDGAAGNVQLFDDVTDSDQFFGLYTALEVGFASFPVGLSGIPRGQIRVSGGIVYDYTWFDLGDYGRDDDGLATLAPVITWTLLH